jgi:hypothetical protein
MNSKSSIVKTTEEIDTIKSFFEPKKIKFIHFLYLASENSFSANQFHGKCDHIPNTLTVCETEFGKKIGGFTPLVWCSNGKYRRDESGQSFVFSLSNKDKFPLHQSVNAIYDDHGYGPTFGNGHDLHIASIGNGHCGNYAKINTNYMCNKYTKDEVGSYQRFSGSSTHQFKVKEWEVWRVVFEE